MNAGPAPRKLDLRAEVRAQYPPLLPHPTLFVTRMPPLKDPIALPRGSLSYPATTLLAFKKVAAVFLIQCTMTFGI